MTHPRSSHNSMCRSLAEHFLSDEPHTDDEEAELAQEIQDAVEDWFAVRELCVEEPTS